MLDKAVPFASLGLEPKKWVFPFFEKGQRMEKINVALFRVFSHVLPKEEQEKPLKSADALSLARVRRREKREKGGVPPPSVPTSLRVHTPLAACLARAALTKESAVWTGSVRTVLKDPILDPIARGPRTDSPVRRGSSKASRPSAATSGKQGCGAVRNHPVSCRDRHPFARARVRGPPAALLLLAPGRCAKPTGRRCGI